MSLLKLIEETSESLDEARFEVETLLMALTEQRQIVADLEDELHGLRLAATRRGETVETVETDGTVVALHAPVEMTAGSAVNLETMSRTDAVLHVLAMTDRPLDRQGVQTRMQTLGRIGDTLDQISLALTNLKRSGRADNVGTGRWKAALSSAQG